MLMMEAAGIEPASGGSEAEQEEEADLPSPDAGQNASETSHEVTTNDSDPWARRGRSGRAATPPGGGAR